MTYRSDCGLLGLDPEIHQHAPDAIRLAYHDRALECHPDKGGSQSCFAELSLAYERLYTEALEAWSRCAVCGGLGAVSTIAGFAVVEAPCPRCGGSGRST